MSDTQFRIGTKEDAMPKGSQWVWVKGKSAAYDHIRSNPMLLDSVDGKLQMLIASVERSVDMLKYMRCCILGGHVHREKLTAVQELLKDRDDPQDMLKRVEEGVKTWTTRE